MERFAELTGRRYRLFDYVGAPDAERVVVLMGSGAGAVEETVEALEARGEKVGVLKVRLYRPFDGAAFCGGAARDASRSVAVLDRTQGSRRASASRSTRTSSRRSPSRSAARRA